MTHSNCVMSAGTVVDRLDWLRIASDLDQEGYALVPGLFAADWIQALAALITAPEPYRETPMARAGSGHGRLLYPAQSLPALLAPWHAAFAHHLAPIANRWNERMAVATRYTPATAGTAGLLPQAGLGHTHAAPIVFNRLRQHDHVALHHCIDGAEEVLPCRFPLQIVALASHAGQDFTGGEFVMTEQRPRMQSRPIVVPLDLGDAAIIAISLRPVEGQKGPYRVNLKHAISRVRSGERIGMDWRLDSALTHCAT